MNKKQLSTMGTRMEIRIPTDLKNSVTEYCNKHNCTSSEFAREAITEKLQPISAHTPTELLALKNKLWNITLAYPNLDKNYIKLLEKEIFNYE